jgi:hypothetical protein
MRQTELHLSDEDRIAVDEIRAKGVHHSREVNRAHTLSCLDRGIPESQIMGVLGIGRTAIWRTRARRTCRQALSWQCSTWHARAVLRSTTRMTKHG